VEPIGPRPWAAAIPAGTMMLVFSRSRRETVFILASKENVASSN
jgi:hypothetical protein